LLGERGLLRSSSAQGKVHWRTSGDPQALRSAAQRWLGI
jgi:hypothetical protein